MIHRQLPMYHLEHIFRFRTKSLVGQDDVLDQADAA